MADLPSFRPRGLIGRLGARGEVQADRGFLQWLDLVLRRSNELTASTHNTGDYKQSASPDEPSGWLICDGRAVSKTDYPGLYAVIGSAFGESASTFNLPDRRNRLAVGAGTVSLNAYGGAADVTLTEANLPAHSHPVTDSGHSHSFTGSPHGHGVTDNGHDHDDFGDEATGIGVTAGSDNAAVKYSASGKTSSEATGVTVDNATAGGTVGRATTGITVGDTGSGDAFSILPPVIGVNWLIKT